MNGKGKAVICLVLAAVAILGYGFIYWDTPHAEVVTMETLFRKALGRSSLHTRGEHDLDPNGTSAKDQRGRTEGSNGFWPFGSNQVTDFDVLSRIVRRWSFQSFEQSNVNCSTEYVAGDGGNENDPSENDALPVCSMNLFRKNMADTDGFPSHGTWRGTVPKPWFQPSFCKFRKMPDISAWNRSCFRRLQSSQGDQPIKLAVMGDSNGFYMTKGLVAVAEAMGYQCATSRKEQSPGGHGRQKSYWAVHDVPAEYLGASPSLFRGHTDSAFTSVCDHQGAGDAAHGNTSPPSLQLEYISASNLMEGTLHMAKAKSSTTFRRNAFGSFSEYLMRHYFPSRGPPDVILVYSPFHHEKWHAPLGKAALDIAYLDGLIRTFLPQETHVLWIPDSRECLAKNTLSIPADIRDGMHTNLRLHALNGLLYKVLQHRFLDPNSGVSGFLDLGRSSCPIECRWHKDGAHMKPAWYELMANFIMQLICS